MTIVCTICCDERITRITRKQGALSLRWSSTGIVFIVEGADGIKQNLIDKFSFFCNFEPKPITRSRNAKEKETTSLPSRANNKDWCKCGRCRPMETEEESKCCRDNGEVPESYFSEHLCITSHANFTAVCLQNKY